MVDSFKEFLEKNQFLCRTPHHYKMPDGAIEVKALGEWAWDNFLEHRRILGNGGINRTSFWNLHEDLKLFYSTMAMDCLGEAEIKRRMEELGRTDDKGNILSGENQLTDKELK